MDDILIYRRKRGSSGQWKCREKSLMKVEFEQGRFVVFEKLAKQLGCTNNDAVMFGFSSKDKCAYIFKEEPEEDSYYLRQAGPERSYYRFTSKDLGNQFFQFFQSEAKVAYFEANGTNDKGWTRLIPENCKK